MNIVKNVELKKGLKRPDLSLRRLAKDETVFAIYWQDEIALVCDDKPVTKIKAGFVVKPLKDVVKRYSRYELEALYQNILYSTCNVWLARFADK